MDPWLITWLVLAVAFTVTEVVTVAFVALYFALGAAVAAVIAGMGGDVVLQLLGFVVTAVALMFLTRPVLKRRLESPDVHTNVHSMVGRSGIVTIPIDNDSNTGQIRIGTEYWTARSPHGVHGVVIPVDARVNVVSIEGVTARVEEVLPKVD